jgi:myosin regulatory light chain 12
MLDELLSSRPGGHYASATTVSARERGSDRGINFTMFLTMMSERLFEFDTEAELIEAFESFDENDTGMAKSEEMRKWLGEVGDRMNQEEVRWFGLGGRCAEHVDRSTDC